MTYTTEQIIGMIDKITPGKWEAQRLYTDEACTSFGVGSGRKPIFFGQGRCNENNAAFIAAAPDIVKQLLNEQDIGERFTKHANAIWSAAFPDEPDGWEYGGQLENHVVGEIERLRKRAVELEGYLTLIGAENYDAPMSRVHDLVEKAMSGVPLPDS